MEKLEERFERLERLAEYFIEEMADFKKWVVRFLSEYKREVDRQIREYKEETNKRIEEYRRENNKRWGELANKLGTIVEDIIYPAFRPVIRKYFGCEPEKTFMRLEYINREKGIYEEFDAVAVCQDKAFLLEAKSTPREKHIEEFKEKAKRFLQYFSEFGDKKLILIMASLSFKEDFVKQLSKTNIYAMAYREWEYMDILNFEEVKGA
ncbi:hypothetical protein IAE16_00940 [Hydrogenobacter sp. T-2]|uniref:hypothetical protein n=1 Tax=Pampinifervens diazotrophicum TaxID=1632018 RepID=UPI002B260648|nr:hypothetical protein [Hydrogenobacter sp. T-2]WPM32262.1 hypothetical protein IAE16_00940 [Hydrogenobacter sp. T-2]